VAGIRNTLPLAALKDRSSQGDLRRADGDLRPLEAHYRDMCDTEFTIDQGKLWMLQTRVGKRTGSAALRMAVDMTKQRGWKITREEAVPASPPTTSTRCCTPSSPTDCGSSPPAWPPRPARRWAVVFDADRGRRGRGRGERVILVRSETSPEDVHGMIAAQGILTARGGLVSHAAVVAAAGASRRWWAPSRCG
jgi:pyruvate,orthophosphate dikinase